MSTLFWIALGFVACMAIYERQRLKAWLEWLRSKPWQSK